MRCRNLRQRFDYLFQTVKGCSFSESPIFPSIRPKYGERFKGLSNGNLGILLPKLFRTTRRRNCSSDREIILKFEAEMQKF